MMQLARKKARRAARKVLRRALRRSTPSTRRRVLGARRVAIYDAFPLPMPTKRVLTPEGVTRGLARPTQAQRRALRARMRGLA